MTRIALLPVLGGCATLGTFQNAETLGKGNWEVGVEPSLAGLADGLDTEPFPAVAVSGRIGVGDRVDLGGRVGSGGVELTGKFGLTHREARVPVSVGLSAAGMSVGYAGDTVTALTAQVPLLVGVRMGAHELVLGPKLHLFHMGASYAGSSEALWSVGGSAGFSARVGPTVKLVPELAFAVPVLNVSSGEDDTDYALRKDPPIVLQVGMGFLFGNPPPRRPR